MDFLSKLLPGFFLISVATNSYASQMPHYDLHMTSKELEQALLDTVCLSGLCLFDMNQPSLSLEGQHSEIIEMGRRNLEWLALINRNRQKPIMLFQPGELRGYPIEEPSSYGPSTIASGFEKLLAELPENMKQVLLGRKPIEPNLPTSSVEEYRKFAKRVDGLYSITLRWETMKPWLDTLARSRSKDIRGYYFLSKKKDLKTFLDNYPTYEAEEKESIQLWLQTLCYNATSGLNFELNQCDQKVQDAVNENQLYAFSKKYWAKAKRVYESFFVIAEWSRNSSTRTEQGVLVSSFRETTAEYKSFLKTNIEDEFNFNDFKFEINFDSVSPRGIFVEWVPDVTPYVMDLGSNHIVMNSRSSLDDWDTQWTIRHEFGHVLGLPDCYFEFYEPESRLIVNYQIDVNDLMCSRIGTMNERIVKEIRGVY